jgi:hypothetical protein
MKVIEKMEFEKTLWNGDEVVDYDESSDAEYARCHVCGDLYDVASSEGCMTCFARGEEASEYEADFLSDFLSEAM